MRQQVRTANHSAALLHMCALAGRGLAGLLLVSMLVSGLLWRLITFPMVEALARSGRAPVLLQNRPWEAFAVLWLGLPLLVAAFIGYPFVLSLIRIKLAPAWASKERRRFTAFTIWSGGLFLLGGATATILWQHGMAFGWRGMEPLVRQTTISTVSGCFFQFAQTGLVLGLLVQIPVLTFFAFRAKKSDSE